MLPALRARLSKQLKARVRALLGIEPWPDLAERHPLFRSPEYRALRAAASPFDVDKPGKPVLERGLEASYLVAKCSVEAGVRPAFHAGFAKGAASSTSNGSASRRAGWTCLTPTQPG